MKLYSLLNQIILEIASDAEVSDAIVKHERVKIRYEEKDGTYSTRYIESYVLGNSKRDNRIIRVYQYAGDTETELGWKTLRTDRIVDWEPMNERPFTNPISDRLPNIPKYNRSGDKSMITIYKQTKF
jgi:predicted DNA-binding transcriptional regulator YafY